MKAYKSIVAISGSTRINSSNKYLLKHFFKNYTEKSNYELSFIDLQIQNLPVFNPNLNEEDIVTDVKLIRDKIKSADLIVIATPEYTHSFPAVLKNMFEWLTKSDAFYEKDCLLFVYTPNAPRGQFAKSHLEEVMRALKSNMLLSELLHHSDINFGENGAILTNDIEETLDEIRALVKI